MIVYISIGNSDDKLGQARWHQFAADVSDAVSDWVLTLHGAWASSSVSEYQNACWCAELTEIEAGPLKDALAKLAVEYGQDSIAWAVAETEFLRARQEASPEPGSDAA